MWPLGVRRSENDEPNRSSESEAGKEPTEAAVSDTVQDTISEHPALVLVFASAVLENSPTDKLYQAELKNLQELIFRENHLEANILKLEFGQYFTYQLRNNLFKHTLELKLYVSTRNLWEGAGARSYI